MSKKVVVENDKVDGKDTHAVSGTGVPSPTPPPTVPFTGTADLDYVGRMTDGLSDFVRIDGKPVATVQSRSSLDRGQVAPGGAHHPDSGTITPLAPAGVTPVPLSVSITDDVGEGKPSAGAGSAFVKVGGQKLLLDGDPLDTCGSLSKPMNSTVTAQGQAFVSCSA